MSTTNAPLSTQPSPTLRLDQKAPTSPKPTPDPQRVLAMATQPAGPSLRRYGWLATRLRRWLGIEHDSTNARILRVASDAKQEAAQRMITLVAQQTGTLTGQTKQVARLAQDADMRLRYYEEHVDLLKSYVRRLHNIRAGSQQALKEQQVVAAAATEPFDEHGVLKQQRVEE